MMPRCWRLSRLSKLTETAADEVVCVGLARWSLKMPELLCLYIAALQGAELNLYSTTVVAVIVEVQAFVSQYFVHSDAKFTVASACEQNTKKGLHLLFLVL
ncbi:unnamed protein product [Schistocephalus solidus]|uniref:Secreted protein n=1 Tax=Schistocephalus solidus TaxID=70667 RepID=A0A183T5Z0_SCHSO|nr:unnamed protein product [Schistocephalus solidus]